MNKETVRFRRELGRLLPCCPGRKRELLSKFDDSLSPFLEDCPAPGYEQLKAAFGPPEEMASVLIGAVPEKEKQRFHLWQRVRKSLLILLFVLVFLFGFYAYFLKEWTITETHSELIPGKYPNSYETTTPLGGD